MLPFVYSAAQDGQNMQSSEANGEQSNGTYGVDFLTDYYKNYEQEQQMMHQRQHERLKEREQEKEKMVAVERRRYSRSPSRSRSGSHSRSRSHSRHRSRDRRGRSRSRSPRKWSHSRYKSQSRSRSRSRDRIRRHRGRSRSSRRRTRSRSWDRSERRRRDRDDDFHDYQAAPPSQKLAMMSLPNDIDRNMITMVMAADGFTPNDIRVIHNHKGGSRSFGFIDFPDIDQAVKWMDYNKGWLTLNDGRRIAVNYAKPDPATQGRIGSTDWICANCTCNNFIKRDKCFKCETSKAQSDDMERAGMHMIGTIPCDTLLIRSLVAGCQTSNIFEGLMRNTHLANIVQIQMADSRQFAYIQMRSDSDALNLFNSSYKAPIKVMHNDVILTWCKLPLKEIIRQDQLAKNASNSTPFPTTGGVPLTGAEIAQAAMQRLAQNRGEVVPQPKQHPYYRPDRPPPVIASQIPVPPPVAQKPGVIGTTQTPHGTLPKYATPDTSKFALDMTTGYFRDTITGFLYDPKSSYYFMPENNVWACWDPNYCTYFNVSGTTSAETKPEQTAEDAYKTESEKKAADAMKEMQKWQKKQDKQKLQITLKPGGAPAKLADKSVFDKAGSSNKADSSSDDEMVAPSRKKSHKRSADDEEEPQSGRKSSADEAPASARPNLTEERERMERDWIDEAKKVCRLCNRAFPSVDVLMKHITKSDLHKKNAEAKREEWAKQFVNSWMADDAEDDQPKIVYRDRARERRAQHGLDGGYGKEDRPEAGFIPSNKKTEMAPKEVPAVSVPKPLDSTNIGNKLLKSMGWKEGQGAGKYGQGIVAPIEAIQRVKGAGLGASGSTVVHQAETSHKDRVRASMMSRFNEIRDQ